MVYPDDVTVLPFVLDAEKLAKYEAKIDKVISEIWMAKTEKWREKMIKKIILPMNLLEELLKLPKGVHIGGIQHNIQANTIDVNVFDLYNALPGDGIYTEGRFDKEKGWVTTPIKGDYRGGDDDFDDQFEHQPCSGGG
jgi:hypothetical protein